MPTTATPVNIGDMVRVVNVDGKPLNLTWNSRPYRIDGHGEAFIPFDCAKLYFGDPRSTDKVISYRDEFNGTQFIPDRATEVRRLMQLWQDPELPFREFLPGDQTFLDHGISRRAPHVEVWSLTNERIWTVLDDPLGDRVIEAHITRNERENTDATLRKQAAIIADQERTLAALMAKFGVTRSDLGVDGDTPAPEPTPAAEPSSVVRENPAMAFSPARNKIVPRPAEVEVPAALDDLPDDL